MFSLRRGPLFSQSTRLGVPTTANCTSHLSGTSISDVVVGATYPFPVSTAPAVVWFEIHYITDQVSLLFRGHRIHSPP